MSCGRGGRGVQYWHSVDRDQGFCSLPQQRIIQCKSSIVLLFKNSGLEHWFLLEMQITVLHFPPNESSMDEAQQFVF